jgi:hypothetical protein
MAEWIWTYALGLFSGGRRRARHRRHGLAASKPDRRQEDAVGLSGDFEVFVPDEAEKSEIKDTRPPSA